MCIVLCLVAKVCTFVKSGLLTVEYKMNDNEWRKSKGHSRLQNKDALTFARMIKITSTASFLYKALSSCKTIKTQTKSCSTYPRDRQYLIVMKRNASVNVPKSMFLNQCLFIESVCNIHLATPVIFQHSQSFKHAGSCTLLCGLFGFSVVQRWERITVEQLQQKPWLADQVVFHWSLEVPWTLFPTLTVLGTTGFTEVPLSWDSSVVVLFDQTSASASCTSQVF